MPAKNTGNFSGTVGILYRYDTIRDSAYGVFR